MKTTPPGFRRTATGVLAAVAVGIALLCAAGWLTGWRTHTMTTPSMGRAAPVGSVVVSQPVSASDIHRGDILVFHPPHRPHVTFVHRVIAVIHGPTGPQFHTRGDINGAADSWTLTASDIIGRSVLHIPDAGFLLQMLPALLLGAFIILLLTHATRSTIKVPVRILAGSLLVAALILIYRPLDRIDLIGQVSNGKQGQAAIVPTGVLPVRVTALHGTHADLTPGQVGTVVGHLSHAGAFRIDALVHLKGWWWLLLAAWGIPAYIAIFCRRPRPVSHWLRPISRAPQSAGRVSYERVQPAVFLCFHPPDSALTIAQPLGDIVGDIALEAVNLSSAPTALEDVGATLLEATMHPGRIQLRTLRSGIVLPRSHGDISAIALPREQPLVLAHAGGLEWQPDQRGEAVSERSHLGVRRGRRQAVGGSDRGLARSELDLHR